MGNDTSNKTQAAALWRVTAWMQVVIDWNARKFNLHAIPNTNTKFDKNRPNTFGNYLSNKNPGRQTDGPTHRQTDRNRLRSGSKNQNKTYLHV